MIKKLILICILHISFIQYGSCQIEIGIKGGFTNAWPGYGELELPEDVETNVNGHNLAFFIGGSFENNFGLSISPGFIKRGAACFPGWQPNFEGDSKVFLKYFDFPILLHKKFSLKSVKLVPSLGYGFSILNSASLHQETTILEDTSTFVSVIEVGTDTEGSFNQLDHGFHFNLRIERNLMENHFIFLESSYYHGMKDYDLINTSKNRNLNYNIGLGYII